MKADQQTHSEHLLERRSLLRCGVAAAALSVLAGVAAFSTKEEELLSLSSGEIKANIDTLRGRNVITEAYGENPKHHASLGPPGSGYRYYEFEVFDKPQGDSTREKIGTTKLCIPAYRAGAR